MAERKFAYVGVEELRAELMRAAGCRDGEDEWLDVHVLIIKLSNDIKVSFSTENVETSGGALDLIGYRTLNNGLTFLGVKAGGDWQHPVFLIVYHDGKRLRGYVPTHGNPWNRKTKCAIGDEDDEDPGDHGFDWTAIRGDILDRFKPKAPAGPKVSAEPKTIAERIEALEYWGDCDEGTELFRQTCRLCYMMCGFSMDKEAEILCGWAEEQAAASLQEKELYERPIKGSFGYY